MYRLLPRDATQSTVMRLHVICPSVWFLQRVSIAYYAERCTSYSKSVRPSLRLSIGSRALTFKRPLLSLSVEFCLSVCGCVCPQLWGQISWKPKELGAQLLWGAYRKVVRGYWMVTSPMTSRDPMTSYHLSKCFFSHYPSASDSIFDIGAL